MFRIFYSIFKALANYRCLRTFKKGSLQQLPQLKVEQLKRQGVACLALDFDGVLNSHAELTPNQSCEAWLRKLIQVWPQQNIVILSNKPSAARINYFKKNFPGIEFCIAPKKKPYPHGLLSIARAKQIPIEKVLLVDDRLLTGMLACCIAGAQGLLIKKPYKRFWRRPIRELFFMLLRTFERLVVI
jgi:putative phosphatase